jgi:hypothetical protein
MGDNVGALVTIGSIIIMGAINAGIMVKGQRIVELTLSEIKASLLLLDKEKLDKELHSEVVRRIDGELGSVRGDVSNVRHQIRNVEQRLPSGR